MPNSPRFSKLTIDFIKKASRQKNPDWLEKHREEFEDCVRLPLQHLASELATRLRPLATGYHFPLKGLGRLKRSADRAREYGSFYKSYVSFTVTRPSKSRFDHNPSLFFMINSEDEDGDEVLFAGGLYMPSSRQLKAIRESIAKNPEPYEALFRSKDFAASFPKGFSDERKSSRPPRGFDPAHSHLEWLKLQGYFVWRSYKKKEYTSKDFPALVAREGKQILRLNELLQQAISNRWPEPKIARKAVRKSELLLERTGDGKLDLPQFDF